jgi:hypothetical protein
MALVVRLLDRIRSLDGMGESGPSGTYLRLLVITALLAFSLIGTAPFIIIAAVVLHRAAVGVAVVFTLVALYLLSSATAVGFKLHYVLTAGYWTGRDQSRIRRADQPRQYWSRFIVPGAELAMKSAAAVVIGYVALRLTHMVSAPS